MTPMADLAFAVRGTCVPADYRFALWSALCALLPWLDQEPWAGLVGLRITPTGAPLALLAQRARLTLRLPLRCLDAAGQLQGALIELGPDVMQLTQAHARPITPSGTLYAQMVVTDRQDEAGFVRSVERELAELGVAGRVILGRRSGVHAGQADLSGFSLAVHNCAADHSMRLQQAGIGAQRGIGCGIFVPYKRIEGID